ncbi:hypothetical protein D3C78_1423080 [compost metagenome]
MASSNEARLRPMTIIPAMCGRTTNIRAMATAMSNVRRPRSSAAHSASPAARNDSASLPMADDQKLTEGRKTMRVARRWIFRLLSWVAMRRQPSKASRPMVPKMLKTRKQPSSDSPKPWTSRVVR